MTDIIFTDSYFGPNESSAVFCSLWQWQQLQTKTKKVAWVGGEKETSQADFPPTSDEHCMLKIIKYLIYFTFSIFKRTNIKNKNRAL